MNMRETAEQINGAQCAECVILKSKNCRLAGKLAALRLSASFIVDECDHESDPRIKKACERMLAATSEGPVQCECENLKSRVEELERGKVSLRSALLNFVGGTKHGYWTGSQAAIAFAQQAIKETE